MNRMPSFTSLQPEPTDQLDPVVLDGLLVRLEPLAPRHLTGLEKAARDTSVFRWFIDPPKGADDMDSFIARAMAEQSSAKALVFAVIAREANEPIGSTRFLGFSPRHRRVEIGDTWIGSAGRKSGLNTEMTYLMLRHAFEVWGLMRVAFTIDVEDDASKAVLEKIGAAAEGLKRRHMLRRDGSWRDSACYSVIADDWPPVRSRLRSMMIN